jgi:Holliday junction resolvasome RuvABC endonuclease subunit
VKSYAVLGIDLSLRNAGYLALPLDPFASGMPVRAMTYGIDLVNDASPRERVERLDWLEAATVEFWEEVGKPKRVAIEEYAFSRDGSHAHELGEAGGVVKLLFYRFGIVVVPVVASSARKLLTGYGGGTSEQAKKAVQRAIVAAGFSGLNEHEADAFATANSVLSEIPGGRAIISPPITKRKGTKR